MTYAELVQGLFPRLTGGVRWGLERTRDLLASVGNPHEHIRSIHVAGTNGKGSVAASIASVLTAAGFRTGLYSSPHLCSFRERIRIDGVPIDEDALVAAAQPLWPAIERSGASFFEATTAIAFSALDRAGVDLAVIEVGLGGRLDSTNVIIPLASVITNIAFDHADYLGDTLEAIAGEKAGIIKSGVPVITAETERDVLRVFEEAATRVNAPLTVLGDYHDIRVDSSGSRLVVETNRWGALELNTPLIGLHQARNAALAVRAVEQVAHTIPVSRESVQSGITRVRWPGRFQVWLAGGKTWVFDVAHNEAGVASLVQTFEALPLPRPVSLLVGILGDKDWEHMLPPLFRLADHIVLTVPPTAPSSRAWDPSKVLARVNEPRAQTVDDFAAALRSAQLGAGTAGTILVTGSFHTVGDAFALLGLCEVGPDFVLPHNGFSR